MLKNAGSWLLSLLILCLATTSFAQVSRYSFEAVATETLHVELRDGQNIHGQLRHVDDTRAVILSEDGEVYEIALKDVAHLRVGSKPAAAATSNATAAERAKAHAQQGVDASIQAAERADQTFGENEPNAGYLEERSVGYLPPSGALTDSPFSRFYNDQSVPQRNQGTRLSPLDYGHYQAMLRGSRVKRSIGWSMFATGVIFLTSAVHAANQSRRYGYDYDYGYTGLAVFGALNTLVGLPVAIAGRQQYRRAAEFAREAAAGRASIEADRRDPAPRSTEDTGDPAQD